MQADLCLYSDRVLLPQGVQAASILIKAGRIIAIESGRLAHFNGKKEDLGSALIMPGLIDAHVHINDPGRRHWEGSLLVDMPLNSSPVTSSTASLQIKIKASEKQLYTNCAFWGGLVPQNSHQIQSLLDSGILGIKAFLCHSGIDEFPNVSEQDLHKAMKAIAQSGLPLLVHCELESEQIQNSLDKNPGSYHAYLQSRPKTWENQAIRLMIGLCRTYNCRVHIVHLSSAEALPMIQQAKAEGLPITVETCPHYLYFHAEAIADGQTQFKCAPPIRERSNQEKLWEALESGLIDFVATDHSPAPPELKHLDSGDFSKAWGGIASLQFLLPVFWTAARKRGMDLEKVSQCLSAKVATFLSMDRTKGQIKVGYDADLVVWQPEQSFVLEEKDILHRHPVSPYLGEQLYGQIVETYLGGQKIYDRGQFAPASGQAILRNQ